MDAPQILVVDDDRDIRTLLSDYLESNGLRTKVAADGPGMWKALDESRPPLRRPSSAKSRRRKRHKRLL